MSKLYKLREWYSLYDARRRLSETLGEPISQSTLLQLCLEGHIRLSWQMTHQYAQEVAPVTTLFNWFGGASGDPSAVTFPKRTGTQSAIPQKYASEGYQPQSDNVEALSGIYELLVDTSVIHEWLLLKIAPSFPPEEPKLVTLEGVFVRGDDGKLWRLMERFDSEDTKLDDKFYSSKNFFPGQIYPELEHLVIRRIDLEDFEQRVGAAGPSKVTRGETFIDPSRIDQLAKSSRAVFDCARLVVMCEELNACALRNNAHAVALLTRAILNHVPPVFGFQTFAQVAANYAGGTSFKQVAERLEIISRKVADRLTHMPISKSEVAPTMLQVNFRSELDVILSEVVRLLK